MKQRSSTSAHRSASAPFFRDHFRINRGQIFLLGLLLPFDIARQLLTPEILRRFIDAGATGRAGHLVMIYFALVLIGLGTTVLLTNVSTRLAWTSTNALRDRMIHGMLRRPASFFQRAAPGELVDRMDNDATRLGSMLSHLLLDLAAQTLLAAGVVAAMFHLDWRFGALFLPFAVAMIVLLRRQTGRVLPFLDAQRDTEAHILATVDEWSAGAEDLRAAGATRHVRRILWQLARREHRTGRQAAAAGTRWPATVQALSVISILLALALGVGLHRSGAATVGTVFAALSYATLIRFPLAQIASRIQEAQAAVVSLRRVREMLHDDPGPGTLAEGGTLSPEGRHDLVFDQVTFAYDDGPVVLDDVSFRLPAGATLGLVGRTGSGKSTLVGLAFRSFDPAHGRVLIGGHDLRSLDRAALRRSVAYIPQGITLFGATLRDNLTLFAPGHADDVLLNALREAGLGTLAETLPDGLDTRLDASWTGLSTGQGQMLNLARAFLTDPAVVLLDEPSSQIDPHTEQALRTALTRFARDRTAIIVTHRLETLDEADHILVLDEGRVLEYGRRADLLAATGSVFAGLSAEAPAGSSPEPLTGPAADGRPGT
ncbi:MULTISPECIES: ABC transporter ATP-binding protein [Actinoplanes]|uniref:ABC transporter ATP-binding protein n=1 Tax=Actinoplanes TaxID=1865 RepID=UPI000698EE35|nr:MULTISPECIES: ABC transporter ATP-binding protein [Actinoplanes]GLY08393.1 helicase [Actinoplanes sp. NBRC 101535]